MSIDAGFDNPKFLPEVKPQAEIKVGSSSKASEMHPYINEDSNFSFQEGNLTVAGVFDGMGGLSHGNEASIRAQSNVSSQLRQLPQGADRISIEKTVRSVLEYADRDVKTLANEKKAELGTTASVLVISNHPGTEGKFAVIGNVGDSRIYLFRDGKLECITLDDSSYKVQYKDEEARQIQDRLSSAVSESDLSEKERHFYRNRNVVGQSLGGRQNVSPNIYSFEIKDGDRFIVTSDGISDNLTNEEIEAVMHQNPDSQEAAADLTSASLIRSRLESFRSKTDDMTVLVIDVPADELSGGAELKEEEYKPSVLFEKGSEVSVEGSNGEIAKRIVTNPDKDGKVVVVVPVGGEGGQLLQKTILRRELEAIVEANMAGAKDFDELKEVLRGLGGLHGSSGPYKSSELIDAIELVRKGDAKLENITRVGGLRENVQRLLSLEKIREKLN